MDDFKQGDIVVLKSGGPPLTVWEIRGDGCLGVEWFDGGELKRDALAPIEVNRWISEPPSYIDLKQKISAWADSVSVVIPEQFLRKSSGP